MGQLIDLMGHVFGLLRVIERSGSNEARQSLWRCECACRELVVVRGTELVSGTRRRCSVSCKFKLERPMLKIATIDGRRGEMEKKVG